MSRTGGSGTGGSAQLEEVQEWRECKSEGSVQVEEGQSSSAYPQIVRKLVSSDTWLLSKSEY